jgi:hypothetical protein
MIRPYLAFKMDDEISGGLGLGFHKNSNSILYLSAYRCNCLYLDEIQNPHRRQCVANFIQAEVIA